MDYFTSIRVFVQVVESGSFVKASQALNLPRNAITRHLQTLEEHLQIKLLNRTTRRISLTNDGTAYYERMVLILDQWLEAESDLTTAQGRPHGRLRVDMGGTIATCLVLPNLVDFQTQYPELIIDIGVSDRPVDLLAERVDCVIRGGTVSDPSLIARRLGNLHHVTVASPGYLERYGEPKHPNDLKDNHPMVRYFFAGSQRKQQICFVKDTQRIEIDAKYAVAVNDSNAFLCAALAGLGAAQTLRFMADLHIKSGALIPILQEWTLEPHPIYIVYAQNRHLSKRVRVFVDWLVDLFEKNGLR